MVTTASPFSRAGSWNPSNPVDALKRPSFFRKSRCFGPLKLRFPSCPRPAVEIERFFTAEQEWRSVVPHVKCNLLLGDSQITGSSPLLSDLDILCEMEHEGRMLFLSWCLVCWAGSERIASARFQLRSRRQRGLEVYLSNWTNSVLLGKLGSLSVTWRARHETLEGTHFAVLALCAHSSWWPLFETIFGKLFSVPRTFGFVFRDQWDKHFQTR